MMRGALTVRINDGYTDRHVTAHADDLRFRKVAPGGHHSASMRLVLPRDTFTDLGPADKVYIYDARTGDTIFEGYTENPTPTDGPDGQEWELSVIGGMTLTGDQSEKLIYLDRALDAWRKDDLDPAQAPSATSGPGQFPEGAGTRGGKPGVFSQLTPGQPVTLNSRAGAIYDAFLGSTMTLGGLVGVYDGGPGLTPGDYAQEWLEAGQGVWLSVNLNGIAANVILYAGDGSLPTGRQRIEHRIIRKGGATNVTTDNVWACLGEIHVLGQLVDRYGADLDMATVSHITTGNPTTGYVLASEVVEDLFGRMLTMCDPATAIIEATTAEIDQIAYRGGATAQQVLADLELHEPDMLWEVLESRHHGLHRFAYRAWPTTPRYEISTRDGYRETGSDVDLCNRIAVYWADEKGVERTTVVTSTVPELGTRIRDADSITLPEGLGSEVNAQRIGEQVLATKAAPPKAATANVRRPIMDRDTGATVMPWEIEPGHVVRVRETGDDLRLTEVEYVDSDCAATLTLGDPVLTTDQLVARLSKAR